MAIDTTTFTLKYIKTDFDNNKNFPTFFELREPYLDVILYLGNQRYPPSPNKENPLNKICFILDWEQNKKKVFKKWHSF